MILTKVKNYLLFFYCSLSFAQTQEPCATDKEQKALFENDSMAYKAYLESERILLEKTLEKQRLLQLQKAKDKLNIKKRYKKIKKKKKRQVNKKNQ